MGPMKERIHKTKFHADGRERVCLIKDGKYKFSFIYRLMAQAFIPNPLNKPFVDHIDREKTNNTLENLRWATGAENVANCLSWRGHPKGVRKTKTNKYQAYASTHLGHGRNQFIHLGMFSTPEEAAAAVLKFKREKYGEFYVT